MIVDDIAEILYDFNPERQPWDGDPYAFHEVPNSYRVKLAYKQAAAVRKYITDAFAQDSKQ